MTDAFVLGVAIHPPAENHDRLRLEELVYHTAHAALENAGVTRGQLDHVTLGACDELDGRSISSMLMAMPAAAYMTDEIRVTDSGASALCLETARLRSGEFGLGMVASWCKCSKTDIESVMRQRGDPFYTRPFGINMVVSDALFAQAVTDEFGIAAGEIDGRVVASYERAAKNPRGMRRSVPDRHGVRGSAFEATPLRSAHRAPFTDGAVCMVVASRDWLRRHPRQRPLARIAGVGWATDSYRLGREQLRHLNSARSAWRQARRMAGLADDDAIEVVELEAQTGYHEAAYVRAFALSERTSVSPSGGPFAQNPLFCTGLVGAAEAVLQVAGHAGPVQRADVRRAAAHSCHGFAQRGNIVMIFEKPEADLA